MKQKSNLLVKFAKFIYFTYRINQTQIPNKHRLHRTLLLTYLFGIRDGSRRTADVQGYQVNFTDYPSFIYLLETLFFEREYAVCSNSSPSLIFDCGSNIGMSILFFNQAYPEAKIIGFEPDPTAFQSLKTNIINNHLSDKVAINSVALFDCEGEIDLFVDPEVEGSLFMSTFSERLPKQKIKVPCEKLSDFINEPVGLLKLDIEGSEMQVLKDLVDSTKIELVNNILIEYHHHIFPEKNDISELFVLLERQGFGYQILADTKTPVIKREFQDILIYAYR